MKKVLILTALLLVMTGCIPESNSTPNGKQVIGVASVIDGDTINIHGQRIRLFGIDAPESSQLCTVNNKKWQCGRESANKLSRAIGRQTVTCYQKDIDRYKRIVAECFVGQTNMNAWMVNEGWALDYRRYSGGKFVSYERSAKQAGRGIWSSEFQFPWDYRKQKRSS